MLKDKINELKKQKGITNAELAEMSGVPLGTVGKIVSGRTTNPQLSTLRALADALGCRMEDFINKEIEEPITEEPDREFYFDPETAKIAQEIASNQELHILFDASRKLSKDDILTVAAIVKRMKGIED